jgi:hypothetical protein
LVTNGALASLFIWKKNNNSKVVARITYSLSPVTRPATGRQRHHYTGKGQSRTAFLKHAMDFLEKQDFILKKTLKKKRFTE